MIMSSMLTLFKQIMPITLLPAPPHPPVCSNGFYADISNHQQMQQYKLCLKSFQNYQNFIEMTSDMIYILTLGVGLKCPRKIHLNTQWGWGGQKLSKIVGHHLWMIPYVQVILFEINCAIFYTNLHELFCQFIS